MADLISIKKLVGQRTQLIESIIQAMESKLGTAQDALLKAIVTQFVDKLQTDEAGNIKNTAENRRQLQGMDKIYTEFVATHGVDVINQVVKGVNQVMDFNGQYFSTLSGDTPLGPIMADTKTTIYNWLGIDSSGKTPQLAQNGYLNTILGDRAIANTIRDMTFKSIIGQKGYSETKKNLGDFITGKGPEDVGSLKKYYRNFVFDTFSQVDRTQSKIIADKIGLKYAIYEGGLIKTSRKFCKERNGKVFTSDEIALFNPTEARPPNYNPITDLGGYGCRHHLNWIPKSLAESLRPDLKTVKPTPPAEPAAEPIPVKEEPGGRPVPAKPDTPFADLKAIPNPKFTHSKETQVHQDKFNEAAANRKQIDDKILELNKRRVALTNEYFGRSSKTTGERIREIQAELKVIGESMAEEVIKQLPFKEAKDEANLAIRSALTKGKDKGAVKIETSSTTLKKDKVLMAKVNEAADFYKVAGRGWVDDKTIQIKALRGNREYAIDNDIYINGYTNIPTIVHELGHILERHNEILKAAVDFLNYRTKDSKVQKLKTLNKAFGSDEVYKDGKFFKPYVGKLYYAGATTKRSYEGIRATEVISMGLERMYHDPAGFYKEDPEHFSLIYNLFFK